MQCGVHMYMLYYFDRKPIWTNKNDERHFWLSVFTEQKWIFMLEKTKNQTIQRTDHLYDRSNKNDRNWRGSTKSNVCVCIRNFWSGNSNFTLIRKWQERKTSTEQIFKLSLMCKLRFPNWMHHKLPADEDLFIICIVIMIVSRLK